ncbi:MAG: glutamyl-tRNA reductase [Eubacteriaceae bacterium]
MEIAVIGVNHNKAPIKIREMVSFTESKKDEASIFLLENGIDEIIILSTCNRSEIFIVANNINRKIELVTEYLIRYSGYINLMDYFIIKKNENAVRHIYSVASGLDSLVLGEDQILGQVKKALEFSIEKNYSGKILNKVFREAITMAKYIKNEFKISENPTSVSYAGLKMLKKEIKSLSGKKALIIGVGNIGKLSLQYIIEENLEKIYITNRTHNKLNKIINDFEGVIPIRYEDRYDYLKDIDILITTTASPHIIIKKSEIPRLNKELFILDLALPRDVEREIGDIENIKLYDIDDLKSVIESNIRYRETLRQPIMQYMEICIKEFHLWKSSIKIDPTIKVLNDRCEEIKNDTLEFIFKKTDLHDRDKEIIEKMMNSALKKSIRQPIINLKQIQDTEKLDDYIIMVNELFRM